jgi:hypothetical protein
MEVLRSGASNSVRLGARAMHRGVKIFKMLPFLLRLLLVNWDSGYPFYLV